jgi:hypothetical protein
MTHLQLTQDLPLNGVGLNLAVSGAVVLTMSRPNAGPVILPETDQVMKSGDGKKIYPIINNERNILMQCRPCVRVCRVKLTGRRLWQLKLTSAGPSFQPTIMHSLFGFDASGLTLRKCD